MKADSTIRKHLKALRANAIDNEPDLIVARVAYAIETAIRWAREDVVGWESPEQQARKTADLLWKEMQSLLASPRA